MIASRLRAEPWATPRYCCWRGVSVGVEREPRHVDDGVHRRADLVAHHREERALRPVRRLRRLLRLGHLGLRRRQRRQAGVERPRHVAQFATALGQPRPRRQVARLHPARGAEQRAGLAQEEPVGGEPRQAEAHEGADQQDGEVPGQRRPRGLPRHVGRNADRREGLGVPSVVRDPGEGEQALDTFDPGGGHRSRAGASDPLDDLRAIRRSDPPTARGRSTASARCRRSRARAGPPPSAGCSGHELRVHSRPSDIQITPRRLPPLPGTGHPMLSPGLGEIGLR